MNAPWTLAGIVGEVNDWRLFEGRLCTGRRVQMRAFLAERQGQPGNYGGLFAPADGEIAGGYRMVTGERIRSDAGSRHILGEEALRALILLDPPTKRGKAAIARASTAMSLRLDESERVHGRARGTYCCGQCSVALWRALAVGGLEDPHNRLAQGLGWLKTRRDGKGGWQAMPFYYTLLALIDADPALVRAELVYARPAVERRLARMAGESDDRCEHRRQRVLERAMERGEKSS